MSTMSEIEVMARTVNGACFVKLDYDVPAADMRKGATDGSGLVNPYWAVKDSVRKVVTGAVANLGPNYANAVNGRLDKDNVGSTFVAQPMKGKVECENPHKCLCQNLDGSKVYLRYMPFDSGTKTVAYMLNGKDISAELKPYLAVRAPSGTQGSVGLVEEHQILWNTLCLSNITKIEIMG